VTQPPPTPHAAAARAIRRRQDELAERIVVCHLQRRPDDWKNLDETGRSKSVRDAGYNLTYLAEALAAGDPALFIDYLAWAKVLFAGLKFPADVISETLECTRQAVTALLEPQDSRAVLEYLDLGHSAVPAAPASPQSFIPPDAPLADLAGKYTHTLLQGDRRSASEMILRAAQAGTPIQEIYLNVFQRSQHEIGRLWQTNQISVAQEHFCTAATQMIMSQLYPYIFAGEKKGLRMVTTCVGGELHEIGARMVADFFEMDGWDTYFLGASVPAPDILHTLIARRAHLLAISATMTFHVSKVTELIAQLRQAGLDPRIRILVGGYPFNLSPDLWQAVGADGTAPDAQQALQVAARWMA
jgi:MerR family transcriptional regulator, light-induced transcriptional regulator